MVDDSDDYSTLLSKKLTVARKEHRCAECRRAIKPGETYLREHILFAVKIDAWKTCSHCQVVREWLTAECGGWLYGGVEEDIYEHAREGGYGIGVGRMAIGIARKWKRRRDGSLLPIPKMPPLSVQPTGEEQR